MVEIAPDTLRRCHHHISSVRDACSGDDSLTVKDGELPEGEAGMLPPHPMEGIHNVIPTREMLMFMAIAFTEFAGGFPSIDEVRSPLSDGWKMGKGMSPRVGIGRMQPNSGYDMVSS